MLYLSILLAVLACVPRPALASSRFINPPNNTEPPPSSTVPDLPTWRLGEQQVISWDTDLDLFNISMWTHTDPDTDGKERLVNIFSRVPDPMVKVGTTATLSQFTWAVQAYGWDFDSGSTFFLMIEGLTSGNDALAYFNIDSDQPAASPSATPTSNATSSNPTSSGTGTGSAATPTPSPIEEPLLTRTAKVALGIGVGFGTPIIGLLGTIIWLKMRQWTAIAKRESGGGGESGEEKENNHNAGPPPVEMIGNTSPPNEMHGTPDSSVIYTELPGAGIERRSHNVNMHSHNMDEDMGVTRMREGNFI